MTRLPINRHRTKMGCAIDFTNSLIRADREHRARSAAFVVRSIEMKIVTESHAELSPSSDRPTSYTSPWKIDPSRNPPDADLMANRWAIVSPRAWKARATMKKRTTPLLQLPEVYIC